MARGMYGADPDRLMAIADDFVSWGDSVDGIGFNLQGTIANLEWQGPDAQVYRDQWGDALKLDLTGLGDSLRDIRGELDAQAEAQIQASMPGNSEGCWESTWGGIGDFFKGLFVDGLWGTVVGIWEGILDLPRMVGFDEDWNWSFDNLIEAWKPLGPFIGYNPEDDSWWNWGLMGDAWWGQVKDFLAWDMWAESWPRALGQVVWNVGSIFIGVGIVKRISGIFEYGRRGHGDGDSDGSSNHHDSTPGANYASGDPNYPGTHPPGRPRVGDSDGGPGSWQEINRREGKWQEYQEQITGSQGDSGRPIEYVVERDGVTVDYDGRTVRDGQPPSEVYLEAKGETPIFSDKNADKPWAQSGQAKQLDRDVSQIERQLDNMPDGGTLEWHVADRAHADMLRERAEAEGLDVDIIHTPSQ